MSLSWAGPATPGLPASQPLWNIVGTCPLRSGDAIITACAVVEINPAFLTAQRTLESRPATWSVPLPADVPLVVSVQARPAASRPGAQVWAGAVEGDLVGRVAFVSLDGRIAGRIIASGNRLYRLRAGPGDTTLLERVDPTRLPPERPPLPSSSSGQPRLPPDCRSPENPRIALLVMYTSAAASYFDHPADIFRWIVLATEDTIDSFATSKAQTTMKVVAIEHTIYEEAGMDVDLERLIEPDDEHLDEVHRLRRKNEADLVILLTRDERASGKASQFAGHHLENTGFAARAFAVASVGPVTGSYVFTHELGHLMGASHDEESSGGTWGAYPWSHGHVERTPITGCHPWRSIMGFSPSSTPRLRWSSPDGDQCGKFGNAVAEDNARTISDTAPTIGDLHCALAD